MKTTNEIDIYGDPERILLRIYQLAADIQDWATLLPHYRYLHVTESGERYKIADFGASRDGFPVKWRARQELFPEESRITYQHIGGISKGMRVEWRITPAANNHVHVEIDHELTYPIPLIGAWFAHRIVGNLFVRSIAGKTLRCIKQTVESEQAARHGASSLPG